MLGLCRWNGLLKSLLCILEKISLAKRGNIRKIDSFVLRALALYFQGSLANFYFWSDLKRGRGSVSLKEIMRQGWAWSSLDTSLKSFSTSRSRIYFYRFSPRERYKLRMVCERPFYAFGTIEKDRAEIAVISKGVGILCVASRARLNP